MGALTLCLPGDHVRVPAADNCLFSACDDDDGRHFMVGFDLTGRRRFMVEAPQRMHAAAVNPARPQQVVFFARRPGTDMYSIDLHAGTAMQRLVSRPGRHFCGHGCFSSDGRYLYVSENDYAHNRGVISVHDADSLTVLEEWYSHGPDPHEIRLLDGGATLAVANGGILTRPEQPGVNLAPQAMQPSLVYLDTADGKMRGEFRLPDRQLSIRHIDIDNSGQIVIALQYEGPGTNRVPLLASHAGEDTLQLFAADACDWRRFDQYTGSVKFAGDNIAAVSSPRGNCLSFWNVIEQKMLAYHDIHDVCGIGYDTGLRNFIVTTGTGTLYRFDNGGKVAGGQTKPLQNVRWDNHLLAAS
jgi:hypothetical protein